MRGRGSVFMLGALLAATALAAPAMAQNRDRDRAPPQRERGMQINREPQQRAPEARRESPQRVTPSAQPSTPRAEPRVQAPRPEPRIQPRIQQQRPEPRAQSPSRIEQQRKVDAVRERMGGVVGRDNQRNGDNTRDRDNNRRDWDKNRDRNDNRNWDRDRNQNRDRPDWRDRDRDRDRDKDRDRWRDHNRRPVVIVRPSPTYHYRPHWWGTSRFYFDSRYNGHYDYDSWYRPGYGFYGAQYGSGWAMLDPWLRQDPAAKHWVMWNFDRNRNGQLSKDEARRANQEFSRLADRNRDGYLDDGEIRFGVEELRDEYRYSFNY